MFVVSEDWRDHAWVVGGTTRCDLNCVLNELVFI